MGIPDLMHSRNLRLFLLVWISLALTLTFCSKPEPRPGRATVPVAMRDGISLSTDLYFPENIAPPFPVILIRTPYNKNWLEEYGIYFTMAGYVVAIQDVRGRWASSGKWEPFIHEGEDGFDTIEWLAMQEWSSGKVGMLGGSYAGTAQFAAAILKPPHLTTIVPNVAPAIPFSNIPLDGGSFAMGWALRWTDIMENAETGKQLQAKIQEGITKDWSEAFSNLPVAELDTSIVGHKIPYYRDWATRSPGDTYWDSLSYLQGLEEVDIPVFLQGAFFDPGTRGTRQAFEHLVRGGNRNLRMIIGPWAHGDRGPRLVNGINMGAEAERDLMAEYRKWFDFWLKTDGSGAPKSPGVEVYVMGSNRWVNSEKYPPKGTTYHPLYLSGFSNQESPGRLSWDLPQKINPPCDTFTYDPGNPTPSFHAAIKRGALPEYMERIQSAGDVLIYESGPLDQPLDLAGPLEARLFASSSARDTDWTATLYAITNSGKPRVIGLTFGILRARYRDSHTQPSLLEPGRVYPFTIDMGHTAVTIHKGERLRLEIASAAFPEFSRNLNTGKNNQLGTQWIKARQCVYHTPELASQLLLPVLKNGTAQD